MEKIIYVRRLFIKFLDWGCDSLQIRLVHKLLAKICMNITILYLKFHFFIFIVIRQGERMSYFDYTDSQ